MKHDTSIIEVEARFTELLLIRAAGKEQQSEVKHSSPIA
jgi:hypothetical protein